MSIVMFNGAVASETVDLSANGDRETLGGADTVASGGLAAGTIQLFVDGALVP